MNLQLTWKLFKYFSHVVKSMECASSKIDKCDNDKKLALGSFLKTIRVLVANESCVDTVTSVIIKARVDPPCNIDEAKECNEKFVTLDPNDADMKCL